MGTAEDNARSEVGRLLLRFISGVVLHNHQVAHRLGLGASDSQFMNLLRRHGPMSPSRLAELTGLTSGSVTAVLDRLESHGFVRRERDTPDRRRVLVATVPEGLQRLSSHYREHGDRLRRVLDARGAAELKIISDFLSDLDPENDQR